MSTHIHFALAAVVLGALGTTACAPVIVGAAATSGFIVAQERSVGNAIDDFGIQTRMSRALYHSSETAFKQIDLEVIEGRVLMTGRVAEQDDRIEAARVAWTTAGVTEVINEIYVSDEGVNFIRPRDEWISTRLRARLIGDDEIRQINYHIQTLQGTVYLFGIAWDEAELTRATEHARTLRGVDRVISHMRLKDDNLPPPALGT